MLPSDNKEEHELKIDFEEEEEEAAAEAPLNQLGLGFTVAEEENSALVGEEEGEDVGGSSQPQRQQLCRGRFWAWEYWVF